MPEIKNLKKLLPWIALGAALMALPLFFLLKTPQPPALPRYGRVPETSKFVSESKKAVTLADFRGQPWVADFIFTSCKAVCPNLTRSMKALETRLHEEGLADVRLVSFSVDPENDTPERLAEYARAYGADPNRWTFLRGELAALEETVIRGFKISFGKTPTPENPTLMEITHGNLFVLVDGEQEIRGYFPVDDEGIDPLVRALHQISGDRRLSTAGK